MPYLPTTSPPHLPLAPWATFWKHSPRSHRAPAPQSSRAPRAQHILVFLSPTPIYRFENRGSERQMWPTCSPTWKIQTFHPWPGTPNTLQLQCPSLVRPPAAPSPILFLLLCCIYYHVQLPSLSEVSVFIIDLSQEHEPHGVRNLVCLVCPVPSTEQGPSKFFLNSCWKS